MLICSAVFAAEHLLTARWLGALCLRISKLVHERHHAVLPHWHILMRMRSLPSAGVLQDAEEQDECMIALSQLARCLDTSNLPNLQHLATAYVHGMAQISCTAPLEALCAVFLTSLQAHAAQNAGSMFAQGVAFLHTRVVILLEDVSPSAALRVLLAAATTASAADNSDTALHMLTSATAVYHRYCALPVHAKAGLMQLLHCAAQLRGVSREGYGDFVEQCRRYASSLPVREDKVRCVSSCSTM
jgi:hypothetical protein